MQTHYPVHHVVLLQKMHTPLLLMTSLVLFALRIRDLLSTDPAAVTGNSFAEEQRKDPKILEMISYLTSGQLPDSQKTAKKLAAQASLCIGKWNFVLSIWTPREGKRKHCVVPRQLCQSIIGENHSGPMGGHFAGGQLYKALALH